jgi:hypothetical protein
MKIKAVCPHHLWDANTCIMQPISISRFTEKIGALLLCFKQKEFFIIFGLVATHESLNPWCRMAPRRSLQTLDGFFNNFEFDFRSAMRSRKSRNPTLEYASDMDMMESVGLAATIQKHKVSGNEMFLIKLLHPGDTLDSTP